MATRVIFHRSFMPRIRRLLDVGIGGTVRGLRDICRASVAIPYPPASAPWSPAHRRTGAYRRALFAERVRQMEWVYGVREVEPDPSKPGSDRGWLGLWLELGTGRHRQPFPPGSFGSTPATTGTKTSMFPRPVLLPTLLSDGPRVISAMFP